MASKLTLIALVVAALCAVDLTQRASSSSSSPHAPAPSVDCTNLVLTMADCLSFVTNGSTVTKPEGTCCSGLKSVLKTAPACLCEAFKSSAQFGVVLNVTKATSLPAACKVSAPSATNCGCQSITITTKLSSFVFNVFMMLLSPSIRCFSLMINLRSSSENLINFSGVLLLFFILESRSCLRKLNLESSISRSFQRLVGACENVYGSSLLF